MKRDKPFVGEKYHCKYHPPKTYSEIIGVIKNNKSEVTWVTLIFGKTNSVVNMPYSSFIRDFEPVRN